MRDRFGKSILRVLAVVALSAFVTSSLAVAGTTGAINGTVTDESKAPIAGAKVTAKSPSETVTVATDAGGHYAFVSLAPDEYSINVEKSGYDTLSLTGVAVFADATQVVPVTLRKSLKTIANVTSRSSASLVRPGTTADVYSVNAEQQARTNVLGGGGNLTSAYSAIAAVPGAYVPTNQNGYNQAVHVRGGDSSEVGYEFDGIPINRGFDNYPGGGASSLGQLELQVYTGATPANAEAQGLAGFVNQVIKTGTYPGYGAASLALGTPTFYHEANAEAGGSSPNRLFSYYAGVGGYNQDHRYIDQFNGASLANEFGPVIDNCPSPPLPASAPASCFTNGAPNVGQAGAPGYILGPTPFGNEVAGIVGRTTVLNFHIGIPHKDGSLRDDVQLLYDTDSITSPLYVSPTDEGLSNFQGVCCYNAGQLPYYVDSYQYTGRPGQFLTDASVGQVVPYLFPSSPSNRPLFAQIPLSTRDQQFNNQNIVKLQYQKNFSADSFLRLYGYTYYSDYVATGAISSWQPYTGFDSGDYELSSHTRGISAMFAKQLSAKNLLQAEASYTTASSLRMNSSQMYNGFAPFGTIQADAFAVVVNPRDLTHGICYALGGSGGAATPTSCGSNSVITVGTPATFASMANSATNGALTDLNGNPLNAATLGTYTCGGGPCSLYTVENGPYGKYNTVKPNFTGYSITDEWRPNEKLLFNLGVRFDQYQYVGSDTTGTAARSFWFNSFNNDTCFNNQDLTLYDKTSLADGSSIPVTSPCSSAGSQYVNATLFNVPSQTFTYNILQPRIGATWTVSPQTVLRASFGKYTEQPSAAYEQYNALQQNLPDALVPFYALGFNTPGHEVRPAISYNYDLSYEHQFKGTDMAVKITPFLRQTHDQIENFYLNIKQGFISGLNAGNQTSEGFEFAFSKGDFARDGFAAQLGFAYTNAYLVFSGLPNGTTILSPINADIQTYNAYTSFCASHPSDSRCGKTTTGQTAAACYSTGGSPDPACFAGDIANPYWNAPVQPLLDPSGRYLPYSTIPGGIGSGVNAYTFPYVASLILQYKHKKLAITPSFQFVAGNRYGAPETMPGIDPALGCSPLSGGSTTGDPRYPYGAAGGLPYDATSCASQLSAIPDSFTKQFDNLGAFREPSQFLMHLRLSYDFTPRITGIVTLANLVSTCFGGQQTPFTYYWSRNTCLYGSVANGGLSSGLVPPVGNVYNPGDNVQTMLRYPYQPMFGTYNDLTSSTLSPFAVYFNLKIKI
ncbi:MAG: TonB-dependent receptor domain-containing protein [Vulcanimicrobiaceae bacterium]